jgi:hypothetical protein
MSRGRWLVDSEGPKEKLEEFLSRQSPSVAEFLRTGTVSNEFISAWAQPGGFDVVLNARDQYEELLKACPAKLREYRKREAKTAARNRLLNIPSVPAGAPRGMRPGTSNEAARLLKLIAEFETKNGTRRGAWDYATKKVYGSESNQRARIGRGQKAVRRYLKMVQKPSM